MDIFKAYGLKPMTLEEEANAPENIKRLRGCKINIYDRCDSIRMKAYTIKIRAKLILEEDDVEYVRLISRFEELVEEADRTLYKALMLGKEE